MGLFTSKKAATFAIVASLPFLAAGSYFTYLGYKSPWPEDHVIGGIYAGLIFLLGSPLTFIYYLFVELLFELLKGRVSNYVLNEVLPILAFPPLPILFAIQWIIWSQLISRLFRRLKQNRD